MTESSQQPGRRINRDRGGNPRRSNGTGRGQRRQPTAGRSSQDRGRRVNVLEEDVYPDDNNDEEDSDFFIVFHSVDTKIETDHWKVTLRINAKNVSCKINSGAQCNVLPKNMYGKLNLTEADRIGIW